MATITAVRFIDTIGQNLGELTPLTYWQDRLIASYTTRSFAASDAQFAAIRHPIKIDQADTVGLARGAKVKDVEPGAASIAHAVDTVRLHPGSVTYMPRLREGYSLAEVRAAMKRAGVQGHYWVADWGFSEAHALQFLADNPDVVAVQWASPTTNPGLVVPGAGGRTIKQLNVDLSVGRHNFWLPKTPVPPAEHPAEGIWRAQIEIDMKTDVAQIKPMPGVNVKMASKGVKHERVVTVDTHSGEWHIQRVKGVR